MYIASVYFKYKIILLIVYFILVRAISREKSMKTNMNLTLSFKKEKKGGNYYQYIN